MTDIVTDPGAASSGSAISLLYAARGLRGFGDGFAIIVLPAYMTAIGYDAIAVRPCRHGRRCSARRC